jgi:hypothetical protein
MGKLYQEGPQRSMQLTISRQTELKGAAQEPPLDNSENGVFW